MNSVVSMDKNTKNDRGRVAGKFFSLAMLARKGMKIPAAICVSGEAYRHYLAATGLGERIFFELHRKNFEEMRWEELWDASLRIRNLFLNTPMPQELHKDLRRAVELKFRGKAVAVRSSAPGEDSATVSFAGLHESYLNITGEDAILDHIRLVWASLWSDRALLYRRELGLRVDTSAMAVIIQEIIPGDRSGVAFSMNPLDSSQAVIEAVYVLNQGLVDGSVEPDRWILDRSTGGVLGHAPAHREKAVIPSSKGFALEALPHDSATRPPLRPEEVIEVFELARRRKTSSLPRRIWNGH